MGLLGEGWDDPKSSAMMALAGGLLKGDFGGGLLGANQAFAQAKQDAMKQKLYDMQMQEHQLRLQDAQRQQMQQQQMQDAIRSAMVSPEKAQSLSMGPMPDGSEPPMVRPGFNPQQYTQELFGIDPMKAVAFQQAIAKDESPLTVAPGASLVDRRTLKPVFTAPKETSLPAAIQEYQFAQQQGYQGTFDQWDRARKQAGASRVDLRVNTDKSYFGNIAEGLAKNDVALIDAARSAPDRIASSRRVQEILATNPITGTGAEARLSLHKALSTAGLVDGSNVANTEMLASTLASQTLDAIKTSGLGAGQGFTDKDRQFLERAKSGNIEMNPEALRRIAILNEQSARATIARGNGVIGRLRSSPESGRMGQMLEPIQEPSTPAPKAAGPQVFDSKPTANPSNKGKVLTDKVTGQRWRSNGMSWVEEK